MADEDSKTSVADAASGSEIGKQPASQPRKPESRTITIREPFSIGGTDRIIYDIGVDGGTKRTFGWRIHDGSKVEIYGSGIGIYDRVILWVKGNSYIHRDINRSLDGRQISFTVQDFGNLYSGDTQIELELIDSKNSENSRYLREKFRYIKQEEKEDDKAKKGKEGAAGGSGEEESKSKVISEILDETIGGTAQAFARGFKGASKAAGSAVKAAGASAATSVAAKAVSEDAGGGDEYTESEVTQQQAGTSTAEVSTGGQVISEGGTAGGTATISQGGTVTQTVGGEISSGGAAQVQGQATVSGQATQTTSATVSQGGTVSAEITGQGKRETQTKGEITQQARISAKENISGKIEASGKVKQDIGAIISGGSTAGVGATIGASGTAGLAAKVRGASAAGIGAQINAQGQTSGGVAAAGQTVAQESPQAGAESEEEAELKARGTVGLAPKEGQVQASVAASTRAQTGGRPAAGKTAGVQAEISGKPGAGQAVQAVSSAPAAGLEAGVEASAAAAEGPGQFAAKPEPEEKVEIPPEAAAEIAALKNRERGLAGKPLGAAQPPATPQAPSGGGGGQPAGALARQPVDGISNKPIGGLGNAPEEAAPGGGGAPGLQSSAPGQPDANKEGLGPSKAPLVPSAPQAPEPGLPGEEGAQKEKEAGQPTSLPKLNEQAKSVAQQVAEQIGKTKKLDSEIKLITSKVNTLVNNFLVEAALDLWVATLPSLGLSILAGAIIGDLLWAFKTWLIKRFLSPLLVTDELKEKGEEIAKQIKINWAVKLNIIGFNAALAALAVAIILFLATFVYVGCNWPTKKQPAPVGYHLSAIGASGYSNVCETLDSALGQAGPNGLQP